MPHEDAPAASETPIDLTDQAHSGAVAWALRGGKYKYGLGRSVMQREPLAAIGRRPERDFAGDKQPAGD